MKDVAIVGLPSSGKSTVFTAVTSHAAQPGSPSTQAVVDVPDERVDALAELYASEKRTYAKVRVVDVAGIDPHALGEARAADALAIVVRAFGADADVRRDLADFRAEMAVADLKTVEKVAERAAKKARTGDALAKAEVEACERAEAVLSDDRWLAEEAWAPEQLRVISQWTPLTLKPALVVVNGDEATPPDDVPEGGIVVFGRLEAEVAELEDTDAAEMLASYGIAEPARRRFVRAAYRTIDLLTFYTGGPTEARAWEVRVGATAPQAAGVIHTDFQQKFIRAERVSYEDLIRVGSEQAAKDAGLMRLEGKDYVVQEGDVLLIRHSA